MHDNTQNRLGLAAINDSIDRLMDRTAAIARSAVNGQAPDADPEPAIRDTRQRQRAEKAAHALILLNEHQDWSSKRIAKEVGVSPGTLSRWPEFRRAVEILANEGKRRLPRAWRTDDGGIEATNSPQRNLVRN